MTYAIIYLRPDGWWLAGDGWEEQASAERAGRKQLNAAEWKVVPSSEVSDYLCEEAKDEETDV